MIGKCEKMKNSEKWIAKNRKGSYVKIFHSKGKERSLFTKEKGTE